MFLFAIGYGVGPQFVRGIAKDGVPQALFAAVVCVFCLLSAYLGARLAGYDVGSAAGLYAGSQTISASMGLATDAINRLGLPPEEAKKLLDGMPVAYAVTYIFGTVGSAIVFALFGPALLGIDLEAACKRYEEKYGGTKSIGWSRHGLAPVRAACLPRSRKAARPSARRCRKPRRCFRSSASSSIASAAMARSSMPTADTRDTGRGRRGGRRPARRAGESHRRRPRKKSTIGSCWRCPSRVSMSTSPARRSTERPWPSWRDPGNARRLFAQDHPRGDRHRHSDPARHQVEAR